MQKRKTSVRIHQNTLPLNNSYKQHFDSLKKPGNSFELVGHDINYASVRAQASKQGKRRKVVYQVSRTENGVIVRLDRILGPQPVGDRNEV